MNDGKYGPMKKKYLAVEKCPASAQLRRDSRTYRYQTPRGACTPSSHLEPAPASFLKLDEGGQGKEGKTEEVEKEESGDGGQDE